MRGCALPKARSTAFSTMCSTPRTRFFCIASATTPCSCKGGRPIATPQPRPWSRRRCRDHLDVRRRGTSRPPRGHRTEIEEGAGRAVGRKRHNQQNKLRDVKQVIRETDALVYAIGIDCGQNRPARRHRGRGSNVGDRSRCHFPFRRAVAAAGLHRRRSPCHRRQAECGAKPAAIPSTVERSAT